MPSGAAQKDPKTAGADTPAAATAGSQTGGTTDTPSPESKKLEKDPSKTLIRKFSLGGDAWNKKKRSSAVTVGSRNGEITEKEEEIDDRASGTESPSEKDIDLNTELENGDDSINVVVRVRPLNKNENERKEKTSVQYPGDGVLWVDNNGSTKPFTFNVLFEPEASQKDVFEHSGVKKLVAMAVDGYTCTCFAFGQTGSGKTHSITGPPQKFQTGNKLEEPDYGLIPRSFHNLLELISDGEKKGISYTIKASYFELYNEQILDLLNAQGGRKLNMRWSANKGFYIENLFTIECETFDDLMAVLEEGLSNRSTSAHNLNDNSSRSHSMLAISIDSEQQDPNDENLFITKHGKLTFVDLAGSEKVKDTNTSGDQLLETNNINKSLLVLGKCIATLGDPKKRNGHIPYRDSKLTKLLADSIGGSGVTLMIACVSPSTSNIGETMNTLRYATRAKKIKNKPVIRMDPRERLIMTLKKEVKVLKAENQLLKEQMHFPSTAAAAADGKSPRDKTKNKDKAGGKKNGKSDAAKPQEESTLENNDLYEMLQEYMIENEALRTENSDHLQSRERLKHDQQYIARENDRLRLKIEELQRFILSGEQPIHVPVGYVSHESTRQNSWYDPHSGLNSASSGNTLRSYRSVPDVYHSVYTGSPLIYSHTDSPVFFKPMVASLPPVKHRNSPSGNANSLSYQSVFSNQKPSANGKPPHPRPSPPVQPGPANTYAQKFEINKSLGARNAFQHSPNNMARTIRPPVAVTTPNQPIKAHHPAMYTSANGVITPQTQDINSWGVPNSQPYPGDPGVNLPMKSPQFDLNEQLRQELMVLEGEIKHTQAALKTTTR